MARMIDRSMLLERSAGERESSSLGTLLRSLST